LSGKDSIINLQLNLVEKKLQNSTPLPIIGIMIFPDVIRNSVLYTLANLARPLKTDGNFIFAHILCPPPPYVFGPDGKQIADSSRGEIAEQIKGYT
jgi:hypothetical protein